MPEMQARHPTEAEEMICEHPLTAFCSCLPRRPPSYVAPHVQMRGPGERLPSWRCECRRPDGRPLLRSRRHASEMDCLPLAEVEAFQRDHPEVKTLANARRMLWLAKNFAPIPEEEFRFD